MNYVKFLVFFYKPEKYDLLKNFLKYYYQILSVLCSKFEESV